MKKILILGCSNDSAMLLKSIKCLEHEPNHIFVGLDTNEEKLNKCMAPDMKTDELNTLIKDVNEFIESFSGPDIGYFEYQRKELCEELPKEPIIHGYQNPRNTIMLSSRRKFSRKSHKIRKKR